MKTSDDARRLSDWMAPLLRPCTDEGILLAAAEHPRPAAVLHAAALARLGGHVRSVCSWEPGPDGEEPRFGDYSCYVLSFEPAPDARLYVQASSEPGQPALLEACHGSWDPSLAPHLRPGAREQFENRGYAVDGRTDTYQKRVAIDRPAGCEHLAREMLDVLIVCFGYDGTRPLRFRRSLESRSQGARVYSSLNVSMLATLLAQCGFTFDLPGDDGPTTLAVHAPYRCEAELSSERSAGPGDFGLLTLTAELPCAAADVLPRARRINDRFRFISAQADTAGHAVVISYSILLDGGVTADHLRAQLEVWKVLVAKAARA